MLITFHNGRADNDAIVYDITQFVTCTGIVGGAHTTRQLLESYLQQTHILRDALPDVREIKNRIHLYKQRVKSNAKSSSNSNSGSNSGNSNSNCIAINESMISEYEHQSNEYQGNLGESGDEGGGDGDSDSDYWDSGEDGSGGGGSNNSYCGVVGCTRSFAHSHVGVGGDNVFGLVQQTGMEAMSKDFYSKV